MNLKYSLLLLLLASILSSISKTIELKPDDFDTYIGKSLEIYSTDTYTPIDQLIKQPYPFKTSTSDVPNLGITKNHHWVKFTVKNTSNFNSLFLQSEVSSNTEFDIYTQQNGSYQLVGHFGKKNIQYQLQPSANLLTIPFELSNNDSCTFYIHAYSYLGVVIPLQIQNTTTIIKSFFRANMFGGVFLGAILIMLLYNLFLFLQIKDWNYFRYVLYTSGIILYLSSFKGYLPYFIDLSSTVRINITYYLCIYTFVSGTTFGYFFLAEGKKIKWAQHIYNSILFWSVCLLIAYFFSPQLGYKLFYITALVTMIFLTCYAISVLRSGYLPAAFYTLGQLLLFIALGLSILRVFNVMPFNFFTFHLSEMGTLLDIVLFSVALASKINVLNEENKHSKLIAMETELKYLQSVKDHQQHLEEEVNRQTKALHITNKELQRQALSAQINPHFIFNVLNSIQGYILSEQYDKAETYLAKFSRLIRFYLTSSAKKFIPLTEELEAIKSYLEIEQSRTDHHFAYTIRVSEDINPYQFEIPSLIILPFLENAVWHGVLNKQEKGNIAIHFLKHDNVIDVTIIDDGIGIEHTRKNNKKKESESMGISITQQKIQLLNEIYDSDYSFTITDISVLTNGKNTGTEVNFTIPFQNRG